MLLEEHDQLVTGIDWAPKSNRIVTCGQDRNAYVWKLEDGVWKPTLVILRINRAATDVKWSPNEDKFAVASGAGIVSVCYFEKDHDWWVSKHIKRHTSTCLKVDWHPNNIIMATSGTDNTCRVVSGFIRDIDKKPGETVYGSRLPFGELLATYPANGWCHSVSWAPSGNQLAFASHDSTVTIMDCTTHNPTVLKLVELPLADLIFLNENTIVGAGHNNFPRTFIREGADWKIGVNLDEQKEITGNKATGTSAAFNMFRDKVDKGVDNAIQTKVNSKHQNYVNCIRGSGGAIGNFNQITTSGLDGKLVIWRI